MEGVLSVGARCHSLRHQSKSIGGRKQAKTETEIGMTEEKGAQIDTCAEGDDPDVEEVAVGDARARRLPALHRAPGAPVPVRGGRGLLQQRG
jgi:hypothetical protein